jgi:hypothetical protein
MAISIPLLSYEIAAQAGEALCVNLLWTEIAARLAQADFVAELLGPHD